MANLSYRLFARIIARNWDVYVLKVMTLCVALASSILIAAFSLHEFEYDQFHKDHAERFRLLQRNTDESYSGNRLSAKIPWEVAQDLKESGGDSIVVARMKIMDQLDVASATGLFRNDKVHAVDRSIIEILSLQLIHSAEKDWHEETELTCLLSSHAAKEYTGSADASGKYLELRSFNDTVRVRIAAVFEDLAQNTHERFDFLLYYDSNAISALGFDPSQSGVYGKMLKGSLADFSMRLSEGETQDKKTYQLQAVSDIYFGPRVLGEEARHGDAYSIFLLICITGLILFLAVSSFMNLTTLSLPYRAKEIAVKKLGGMNEQSLLFSFVKESMVLVGISLTMALIILVVCDIYVEPILGISILHSLLNGDPRIILIIILLFVILTFSPVFMALRFIRASPNRLLGTDTITFPRFKRIIAFLQLGTSIFLIIASMVVRRQIDYSLLKEPGRNHDQVVYLKIPAGITNEGISALRSGWKKYNPNILDVMAVSQLPDRISSKEVGSEFYTLKVDPGFREFFNLQVEEGNWFRANAGDSTVITNKRGKQLMGSDTANVIGIIEDFGEDFNQPGKPLKISLADGFNYNWLCVRVLEVDIRRTVTRLAEQFTTANATTSVHYLSKRFEKWISYQDGLNVLSGALALISALLSCSAIYGLSVSLVREKMKQIAIHKMYGAHLLHIVRLLVMEFARQMFLALIVFAPVTYIFLKELLRNFVYATELQWLDPIYPIAYCAVVITALCVFHALSLNRTDLTHVLKRP